jgi:hypothetical protein
MRNDEIVVVANDVVPGMSLPVASPGLRAWGLAGGLRRRGRRVTIAVDARVVRRAWRRRGLPPPRQRDTVIASPPQIGDLIRARKPCAVIITNARHFEELGDTGDSALIYDFFAAKMLEFREDAWEGQDTSLAEFRERKLKALRQCAAVIINGAKKLTYVDDWLVQAGCPNTPRAVVNMPVEPYGPSSYAGGPVHVVVAGYIHPWSQPGEWAAAVAPFVRDGSILLHLVVGAHWTGHRRPSVLPRTFASLAALEGVRSHAVMEYGDFRRFMATCHLSLDLFERNPERELAFVTRTAVALAGGLPVIHVPFTEVSPLIERRNAGWLLNCDDLEHLTSVLRAATEDPEALARKQAGARQIASDLDPVNATAPLDELLNSFAL